MSPVALAALTAVASATGSLDLGELHMPLNLEDAQKAIRLYSELADLRAARETAENYYGEVVIVVSNSHNERTVKIDKQVGIDAIAGLIGTAERVLEAMGFDPDA